MTRGNWVPLIAAGLTITLTSCGKEGREDDTSTSMPTGVTAGTDGTTGLTTGASGAEEDTGQKLDVGGGVMPGCGNQDIGCTDQIDLLFVIDNSGTMGEEQLNLARNFPLLIDRLENLKDSNDEPVNPDVQIMVTTTDFGNPLCTPFEKPDYDPAKGAPIDTPCTDRLGRFTGLTTPPVVIEEACTQNCPSPVAPEGDPFIAFSGETDNIPDAVLPADINGDGMDDSPVAQALACIGPQGIDGCGYEAPLETMLQALNPSKDWNKGARPFLRPGALLAIAVITDEADCSVKDYSVMDDPNFQETDPVDMTKKSSSAICWNAGVDCQGPDANGVYSSCESNSTNDKLQPIERYTNYLIDQLREAENKEVIMLGILGVPLVTEHNPDPPFEPIAGGVADLVYRNWKDGTYPAGDILPDEAALGETAADKQFDFGIGPGCIGEDGMGGFTGQAIPPVRVKEVCESLNIENDDGTVDVRCCIESICDTDFSAAIECLTGIISETITLPG